MSQFCEFNIASHAWLTVRSLPLTTVGQHFLPRVVVYPDWLLHPRVALDVLQCGPVVLVGVEQPRNHLHQICQQTRHVTSYTLKSLASVIITQVKQTSRQTP